MLVLYHLIPIDDLFGFGVRWQEVAVVSVFPVILLTLISLDTLISFLHSFFFTSLLFLSFFFRCMRSLCMTPRVFLERWHSLFFSEMDV